jgi:hypothetical protein
MVDALSVLVEAFVGGRHQIGTIAILQRRKRTSHQRWFSKFSNRLSGSNYGPQGQFARGKAFASQHAAVGAKGIGGDDALLFEKFQIRFSKSSADLSKDFRAAEVVIAAIGGALEGCPIFGRQDFL